MRNSTFVRVWAILTVLFVFCSCLVLNRNKIGIIHEPTKTVSCVLQDAVCTDGVWSLYGEPLVFDEECCEIMNNIFNRDMMYEPVACYAEHINGCYIMHLD